MGTWAVETVGVNKDEFLQNLTNEVEGESNSGLRPVQAPPLERDSKASP